MSSDVETRNNGANTVDNEPAKRPLPVPMWQNEILSLQQAAFETNQSEKTIRRLCIEFGIGRRSARGGHYQISSPALQMVMSNDLVALELLRAGQREAPEVIRYLRALQLVA
ncbi:hypothetical protein [Devosia alba]|uniref:hypothetical protein n=1 Tax=Devosia alba TaxID=3152360 RepID=UPI0032667844